MPVKVCRALRFYACREQFHVPVASKTSPPAPLCRVGPPANTSPNRAIPLWVRRNIQGKRGTPRPGHSLLRPTRALATLGPFAPPLLTSSASDPPKGPYCEFRSGCVPASNTGRPARSRKEAGFAKLWKAISDVMFKKVVVFDESVRAVGRRWHWQGEEERLRNWIVGKD